MPQRQQSVLHQHAAGKARGACLGAVTCEVSTGVLHSGGQHTRAREAVHTTLQQAPPCLLTSAASSAG